MVIITYSENIGKRSSMEDLTIIRKKDNYYLLSIFDGHGGKNVINELEAIIDKLLDNFTVNEDNIRKMYDDINVILYDKYKSNMHRSGSTALICFIVPNEKRIYVSYIGDSKAILFHKNIILNKTDDKLHKPDNPIEYKRIYNLGGFVLHRGRNVSRVNGELAVARSFGDFQYQEPDKDGNMNKLISHEPNISVWNYSTEIDDKNILLLACDGIFDILSDEDILNIINNDSKIEDKPNIIIENAMKKGSTDNCSVVICTLY